MRNGRLWAVAAVLAVTGTSCAIPGGSADDTGDTGTAAGNPCLELPRGTECATGQTNNFGEATLVFTIATYALAIEPGVVAETTGTATVGVTASSTTYECQTTAAYDAFENVECEVSGTSGAVEGTVGDWIAFDFVDYSSGLTIPVTLRITEGTGAFDIEGVWGFYECASSGGGDTDSGDSGDTDSGDSGYGY